MVVVAATPRTEQGRANSLLEFSAIAGITLSPALSGLTASWLHWRVAFGLASLFVSGAFMWVLYTRRALSESVTTAGGRHNAAPDPASRPGAVSVPAHTGTISVAYITAFVQSFIWSGFLSTALPLFGGEVVGVSTSTLGLVFTVGLLADLVLLLPMGWLADRLEARIVLTPAMLLMAGALAYLPWATRVEGLLLVSIGLHTSFAAWGMPSAALALCTPREHLTRTMGMYRLTVDGAVVIAPWLIGTLIGWYGYALPAWLAAVLVALTALLVGLGLRAPRP
jgi:MFS family permease